MPDAESVQRLLFDEEGEDIEENRRHVRNDRYSLSPRASVVGIIGLLCIFLFILLTVFFGILYFKVERDRDLKLPKWPKPSHSLLGEYSTAAVAADNELCSDMGRDILLQGGNAVDASIGTLFCIGVMDTQSSGIGGGHFMTIYIAKTKTCHVIDAREVAPLAATENMYKDRWNQSKYGWKAVAVPGEVHGLWTEYTKFGSGKIPWSSLIQPTITLMEEGYPTSAALASALKRYEKQILDDPIMRSQFINPETGYVYQIGEQIKTRKNLIATLKVLAKSDNPINEFYRGNMTKSMVDEFQKYGGLLTLEDFSQYTSKVRTDNDVVYTKFANSKLNICGPPPPSGAAVAQAILNIMHGLSFNLNTFDGNVDLYHAFIEASKFSYAVRSDLGDMDFIKNATDIAKQITSQQWADTIRSKLTSTTHPDAYYGGSLAAAPEDHGTSHISIVDKDGNAVSVTATINLILGALVMSESTGILWNDEMDDFSSPGHPNYFGYPPTPANYIRPKKRPMSSMSPLVVFKEDTKEVMAIGGAGGSTIISGVAGVALHNLWLHYDIKQSVDFPRLHNQLKPNSTYFERDWPKEYLDALKDRGHTFQPTSSLTVVTTVHKYSNRTVLANSDYRKGSESEPAGY